jgi:hypothetical protein
MQKVLFPNEGQISCCFLPAADIEFFKDAVHVIFNRAHFDYQMLCDLLVVGPSN